LRSVRTGCMYAAAVFAKSMRPASLADLKRVLSKYR
jgi:hypothetical protein